MVDLRASIDLNAFAQQLADKKAASQASVPASIHSTVLVASKSPQVGLNLPINAPDFHFIEIKKDGLDNLYLSLNWRINRSDGNSGNILKFKIYKRFLSESEFKSFVPLPKSVGGIAYNHFTNKSKRTGRFSEERKATNNIESSLIPLTNTNPNLEDVRSLSETRLMQGTDDDSPSYVQGAFEAFLSDRQFKEVGQVDYASFLEAEREKRIFVQDRETINFNFYDKNVAYGQTVEYYVAAVTRELSDEIISDTIRTSILEDKKVSPPQSVIVRQNDEVSAEVVVNFDETFLSEKISLISVYRRSLDEDVEYKLILEQEVSGPSYKFKDFVEYGKFYSYRIYLSNVYGFTSEPKEVKFYSSVQSITPESRSNSLRRPIFSVIQDQNSNFLKIIISPNDPLVSFYVVDRIDLSTKEKLYYVPSSWEKKSFMVEKTREPFNVNNFKTLIGFKLINIIDDSVVPDHIYKYRIYGSDLFGNMTSYSFQTIKAIEKKSIRSAINLNSQILRDSPFRIKIKWDNDNLVSLFDNRTLFSGSSAKNTFTYRVERRKSNEQSYEKFPDTLNTFIIDEISTNDFVQFSGDKVIDNFVALPNKIVSNQDTLVRPFGMPNFLKKNATYYYRVKAISSDGKESNFSDEIKVDVFPRLSPPLNFQALTLNTKVKPLSVGLFWNTDPLLFRPDRWVIEKKLDVANDSFVYIGSGYLDQEFFDREVQLGNTYVYRIKSVDLIGRESAFVEVRIKL
jgi:hypothetical protein